MKLRKTLHTAVTMFAPKVSCCCSLKIWIRVVGWFQVVSSVGVGIGLTIGYMTAPRFAYESNANILTFCALLWGGVVFSVIIGALMLFGNEKGRAGFFWPWIIANWIGLIFSVIAFVVYLSVGILLPCPFLAFCIGIHAFLVYLGHQRKSEIETDVQKTCVKAYQRFSDCIPPERF